MGRLLKNRRCFQKGSLRCCAVQQEGFGLSKRGAIFKSIHASGSVWIPESLLAVVVFFLVLLVFIVVISFYYR
tara:strand:- start:847 stop:1065 length:219 start_codon:yes stop_codon:yes gene_type:complete